MFFFRGIIMPTASNLQEFLNSPVSFDHLNLWGHNITDADCLKLGAALKNHNTFKSLSLHNNPIGHVGARTIAEAVKNLDSLTLLELCGSQIGTKGAKAIAEGIKSAVSLTHLNLTNNQIGDAGAIAIVDGIKDLNSLSILYLNNNQIGDVGAIAIGEGITGLNSLSSLFLYDNQIGDNMVIKLQQKLGHLKLLQLDNQNPVIIKQEEPEVKKDYELYNPQNIVTQKDVEISSLKHSYESRLQLLEHQLIQSKQETSIVQSKLDEQQYLFENLIKRSEELQADKQDLRNDKSILQEQNKLLQSQVEQIKAEADISLHTSQLLLSDMPIVQSSVHQSQIHDILDNLDTVESVQISGDSNYTLVNQSNADV